MDKKYVLVVNGEILSSPMPIPENYKNISNFYALSDEELADLSWSGNEEGFWLVNSDVVPTIDITQNIASKYILNSVDKTCHESFIITNASPEEQEVRRNRIKSRIRMIRDQYLVITDFTQLSDSPISDNSKLDFKVFRQELRVMLDVPDITKVVWPNIPTSASNINIPPFPEIKLT
jgi:hypothetical protein